MKLSKQQRRWTQRRKLWPLPTTTLRANINLSKGIIPPHLAVMSATPTACLGFFRKKAGNSITIGMYYILYQTIRHAMKRGSLNDLGRRTDINWNAASRLLMLQIDRYDHMSFRCRRSCGASCEAWERALLRGSRPFCLAQLQVDENPMIIMQSLLEDRITFDRWHCVYSTSPCSSSWRQSQRETRRSEYLRC